MHRGAAKYAMSGTERLSEFGRNASEDHGADTLMAARGTIFTGPCLFATGSEVAELQRASMTTMTVPHVVSKMFAAGYAGV